KKTPISPRMIIIYLFFYLVTSKLYYLSDIKYPIPYCDIDITSNKSYHLNNIMGTIDISNDPLLLNLIIKFYLTNISSCYLCNVDKTSHYCNNDSSHIELFFTPEVDYNFWITVKKEGDSEFSSQIKNLTTKYKIEDNNYSEIQIP